MGAWNIHFNIKSNWSLNLKLKKMSLKLGIFKNLMEQFEHGTYISLFWATGGPS